MRPALFLSHHRRREQPNSLRMFNGSAKAPGTKVFAQPLNYLKMIIDLEIALSARVPVGLQTDHPSGSVQVRTEAAGTLDIGKEMLPRVLGTGVSGAYLLTG